MRKFLLFALLLTGGLLLLYWLDRQRAPAVEPTPSVSPVPTEAPGTEQGVHLGGRSKATLYDEQTALPLLKVESDDSRTEGGVDHLSGVRLELLDPEQEGVVQCRMTAERARWQRLDSEGELHPRWEYRVFLEGVQAQVLTGVPLAPLSFRAPTAVVDARDGARRVATEDPFTALSPELDIAGEGLVCELDRSLIEIRRGGRVELRRESSTPATFATTGDGPLQVRREAGAGEPLVLETWEGARLELVGPQPGLLAAQHVALRARPQEDAAGELAIERLDADGSVEWTSGDSLFEAERATASFAPGGRLDRARLSGLPRAELELSPDALPAAPSTELRQVVVSGRDTLDLTWQDDGFRLQIEGQPSVETSDFRLRSATGIGGWLAADRRSARFSAGGGVVVESGLATLETATFELRIDTDAQGETLLHGTASGGASLVGTLPAEPGQEGRGFTLSSPDGLEIERTPRGWRVLESTHVEVSLEDPDGFRARADRVSDFDFTGPATPSAEPNFRFLAQGAIVFEHAFGRFGGERLELRAVEPVPSFVLAGTRESKAFYEGENGRATALEVEGVGQSLHARGEVEVSIDLADPGAEESERYELTSAELVLDRSESPELLPGERQRGLRLVASGGVQGSVVAGERTYVLRRAERLSAERRERRVAGVEPPTELGSLLLAEGGVQVDVLAGDSQLALECDGLEIERAPGDLGAFGQLSARGNVRFQDEHAFGGEGELLLLDAQRHGSLQADRHGRVLLFGKMKDLPFRMSADRVDFDATAEGRERIQALEPEFRMPGFRGHARHFSTDRERIELSGGVRSFGSTATHVPWTLDADQVVMLLGRPLRGLEDEADAPGGAREGEQPFDAILAEGGVDFRLGDRVRARGRRLTVRRATGVLRLDGAPATFETSYARLETEWVEFDPLLQVLVATGPGRMRSQEEVVVGSTAESLEARRPRWTVEFLSASTLLELDSLVFVLQEPVFRTAQFDSSLRASWAVLWVDRALLTADKDASTDLLAGLSQTFEDLDSKSGGARLPQLLAAFRSSAASGALREVYFEGPVEVLTEGELVARADAIYLDAASQHGWLARATVNLNGEFVGREAEPLVVKADWLRLSSDGSLRADRATVTPCTFDDPHVRVVTGDLRIVPLQGAGKEHFRLTLKDNRVELYDRLRIPLPTIDVATDEELDPLWPTLSLADSARFGTLFSFALTRPADNVGQVFDKVVRGSAPDETAPASEAQPPKPRSEVDAHYKVDGSYLGSRGGLLDLGLEIEAKEDYWFDLYMGLVYDDGDDRGYIRVDPDDRDVLRRWLRSQAYFRNGDNAWSFSYSDQSDAGVQSEFFESKFQRYERSESYLQWRRSAEENFVQASAKVRTDSFRPDIEELPSLSGYRGRSPLFSLGKLDMIHTGDLSAEYLRRREGQDPVSPFALPPTVSDGLGNAVFPDGLGNREVLRMDTTQALELPLALGAGWKLTPFVAARATAWNEGVDTSDSPTRVVAEAGARIATTLWKRGAAGSLHQIAPYVEARTELERSDQDGIPVEFDSVESQLSGDFLRLGARTRVGAKQGHALLDLDLAGTHAAERSDGFPDGWLPLEVFARLEVEPFGHLFEVFHDGRYDVENSETTYSLVSLATQVGDSMGLQAGHQRGRDALHEPLFEAATVSALYRWTEKWEFEAREAFSLLEDQKLDTRFVVRRYGHDIVFELETSYREGEGSSVGISVRPRFGFNPPRIGYVPW